MNMEELLLPPTDAAAYITSSNVKLPRIEILE